MLRLTLVEVHMEINKTNDFPFDITGELDNLLQLDRPQLTDQSRPAISPVPSRAGRTIPTR